MTKRGLRTLTAMLTSMLLLACTLHPEPVLRVGTNVWPGYEPLYLARSLDYFPATDVRLVEFTSATQVIRAFRNRAIDAATLTLDETLLLGQDVPDIRIVAVMDVSSGADVVLGKPALKTLSDLRGKRVGVEESAAGGYLLHRALRHADMSEDDVEKVSLQVDEHARAFAEGKIDAVVTFEPTRTKLLATGASVLFDSSQLAGEVMDVLVVHRDFLERYPERVQLLVGGWFRSIAYLEAQPALAANMMAPRLHVSAHELLDSYRLIDIPRYDENLAWLGTGKPRIVENLERLSGFMLEAGLLRRDAPVSVLPDARTLNAIHLTSSGSVAAADMR